MQLSNAFTIARPVEEVYRAFLDVERIATCMPGSRLLGEPEPGTFEGEVKVKVGPLSVNYLGQFTVLEADDDLHRLTMRAKGRETRGAGNADAHIVASLSAADGATQVQLQTDLDIRGKVAQFGRGVIGEVTDGIMSAFARNVEQMLVSGGPIPPGHPNAHRQVAGGGAGRASERPLDDASAAPATETELDAWSLIVRPMLQRHGAALTTVAASAVAAWLGARAGTRGAGRRWP